MTSDKDTATDSPITSAIYHEILAFEELSGRKPSRLVLVDNDLRDRFFSEIYRTTMQTPEADFRGPGQFMGVPFSFKNIWVYGGSCKWLLLGDDL